MVSGKAGCNTLLQSPRERRRNDEYLLPQAGEEILKLRRYPRRAALPLAAQAGLLPSSLGVL
jgi:hypothetical protein